MALPKSRSELEDMRRKPAKEMIDGFREAREFLCLIVTGDIECLGLGARKLLLDSEESDRRERLGFATGK